MLALRMKFPRTFCLLLAFFAWATAATAGVSHFASIRRDEAFLREGPSYAHKVLWVYHRRSYPLQVIGSFDAWRHVRDVDGAVGWMHHTQLADARSILFISRSTLRAAAAPTSKTVAFAQPGVVARLKACKPRYCKIDAAGTAGWVDRQNIWGVDAGEIFE